MINKYLIEGMTCGGCVSKIKQSLEGLNEVEKANIQLEAPQGRLSLSSPVNRETLQEAIGHYLYSRDNRRTSNQRSSD